MTRARKIRPGQRRCTRPRLPGRPPKMKPAANPTMIAISRNIGLPSATECTPGACGSALQAEDCAQPDCRGPRLTWRNRDGLRVRLVQEGADGQRVGAWGQIREGKDT